MTTRAAAGAERRYRHVRDGEVRAGCALIDGGSRSAKSTASWPLGFADLTLVGVAKGRTDAPAGDLLSTDCRRGDPRGPRPASRLIQRIRDEAQWSRSPGTPAARQTLQRSVLSRAGPGPGQTARAAAALGGLQGVMRAGIADSQVSGIGATLARSL
jgi:excinuclease UvrABC nuclease subunit